MINIQIKSALVLAILLPLAEACKSREYNSEPETAVSFGARSLRPTFEILRSHANFSPKPGRGAFPDSFHLSLPGLPITVLGAGDLYLGWSSLQYRMNFIVGPENRWVDSPGFFDAQGKLLPENPQQPVNGTKIPSYDDRYLPAASYAYVLSPNRFHVPQAIDLLHNAKIKGIYCEKPITDTFSELPRLEAAMAASPTPIYFGDHYIFQAAPLLLLLGVPMPYANLMTLEGPGAAAVQTTLKEQKPVFDKIRNIEVRLMFSGDGLAILPVDPKNPAAASGNERRFWLRSAGVLDDLYVHLADVLNLAGLETTAITGVTLDSWRDSEHVWLPLGKARALAAEECKALLAQTPTAKCMPTPGEDRAMIGGKLNGNIPFNVVVGQFLPQATYILIEDTAGRKLRFDFATQSVDLYEANGTVSTRLRLEADPYLLTIHHSLNFFRTGETTPLFYSEQKKSLDWIQRIKSTVPM